MKVYDLARQELTKKLQAGVKWISSIDIHPRGRVCVGGGGCVCEVGLPAGDNLILGGYDKRVCWFDLDLSSKPYRVIR